METKNKQECSDANQAIQTIRKLQGGQILTGKNRKTGDAHQANQSNLKYDEVRLARDFTVRAAGRPGVSCA